jgi:hypothetical protein
MHGDVTTVVEEAGEQQSIAEHVDATGYSIGPAMDLLERRRRETG